MTPAVTPTPTPDVTPTPDPVSSIADARVAPDGSLVTIEGLALTDADFSDGGGFLADDSGGIAVLLSDGAFTRGQIVRVGGAVDDRYQQRTIRASGDDLLVLGAGVEPDALAAATGAIGEALEGQLVELSGIVQGGATALSGALAFDVDDGSGTVRVYVGDLSGIETSGWASGVLLRIRGVVGQRDSSGTGTSGYRIMPRDPADVLDASAPTPTPSASATPTPSPGASATPDALPLLTVAEARAAGKNAVVRVRGVVTLSTGLMDPGSAALQDASGAIFLRPSDDAGALVAGTLIELIGTRSSWTGMESIRVSMPPTVVGSGPLPEPAQRVTGAVGEPDEARLISVHGAVVSGPQRTSAQNVYFDLDDGSGPLRVYLSPQSGVDGAAVARGSQLEIRGVLLQETTGQQPLRGYRLWPTRASDLVVVGGAEAPDAGSATTASSGGVPGVGSSSASGRTAAPSPSPRAQPQPRLAAAQPTASPAVVVTNAGPAAAPDTDDAPLPPALPVTVAAVALAGASGLLARGGLVGRLTAQLTSRLSTEPAAETGPEHGLAPTLEGAPMLVPLGVAAQPEVRPDGRTLEHGGILPRT